MALKSELMACGMHASLAKRLGFDPPAAFTAAGNSQGTATLLTSNHANVTTTGGSQGVILNDAEQQYFITTTGGNTLSVYPPSGANFSSLSANTAISLPNGKSLFIEPGGTSGITWSVSA